MGVNTIKPGLWEIPIRFVNSFLVDTADGTVLIDTGVSGSAGEIIEALRSIGKRPEDIRQILVTHCHSDHSGSLAELKRITGAPAVMHPEDAAMVRDGLCRRPLTRSPGLLNAIIDTLFVARAPDRVEPAAIDIEAADGDVLLGGLRAIHVPGHCAGQLAFLWPEHRGVLFAADSAAHAFGLALSPAYEDHALGVRSLRRLSGLSFEVACFGHGKSITTGASERFRKAWPSEAGG